MRKKTIRSHAPPQEPPVSVDLGGHVVPEILVVFPHPSVTSLVGNILGREWRGSPGERGAGRGGGAVQFVLRRRARAGSGGAHARRDGAELH